MTHAFRLFAPPGSSDDSTESSENTLHTQYNGRRTSEEKSLHNRPYPPDADEVHAPESGRPSGESIEGENINHIYGLYRFDSDDDPIEILNMIDTQILGDEEWAAIDYHRCKHDDPNVDHCTEWDRMITRGPVPESIAAE